MSKGRVLLGMSGGVDSSAAALLLQQNGYDVVGFTLDMFSQTNNPLVKALSTQSEQAINEARQVCNALGIPHETAHAGKLFERSVIQPFCDMYWHAQTPNPCILCNTSVKFALMNEARLQFDCSFMATGHYAKTGYDNTTKRYWLGRARDEKKDQSYFLYNLSQELLAHILFPLGDMTKQEIRALAGEADFKNAQKPESQDICFIHEGNHIDFLLSSREESPLPGPIVNRSGKQLGTHTGLINYTIGQRKGIGVAAAEPLYVFKKDLETNTLIVDFDAQTKVDTIEIGQVNYVSEAQLCEPCELGVKTHYRQKPQAALIEPLDNDRMRITFAEPQRACAPGQAAVCYQEDRIICGGTIL